MLRPCPECKKEVSDRCVVCPNCGWWHESIPPIEHRGMEIQSHLAHIAKLEHIITRESWELREEIKKSKSSFSLDGTYVEFLAKTVVVVGFLALVFAAITYCKAH